jgi:hypothetical protein
MAGGRNVYLALDLVGVKRTVHEICILMKETVYVNSYKHGDGAKFYTYN